VQPEIAKFVQVCSYDRAGMAYSDRSSRRRTSRVFAEELHTLLRKAGVDRLMQSMAGYVLRFRAESAFHVWFLRVDVVRCGVHRVPRRGRDDSSEFGDQCHSDFCFDRILGNRYWLSPESSARFGWINVRSERNPDQQ